jgi:hypothetical protein
MQARHDRIGAIVILAICAVLYEQLSDLETSAAMFPTIIIGILAGLTVLMLAQSFFIRPTPESEKPFFIHPGRFIVATGMTLAYIAAVQHAGYFTASILFVPGIAYILGYRNKKILAGATAGYAAFAFIVFKLVFERPLPPELLFTLLSGQSS